MSSTNQSYPFLSSLTPRFLETIAEGWKITNDTSSVPLVPRPQLLCIGVHPVPPPPGMANPDGTIQRLAVDVIDASNPPLYKATALVFPSVQINPPIANVFALRGRVLQLDSYRTVASKNRLILLITSISLATETSFASQIEALTPQNHPGWTSVKQGLPDERSKENCGSKPTSSSSLPSLTPNRLIGGYPGSADSQGSQGNLDSSNILSNQSGQTAGVKQHDKYENAEKANSTDAHTNKFQPDDKGLNNRRPNPYSQFGQPSKEKRTQIESTETAGNTESQFGKQSTLGITRKNMGLIGGPQNENVIEIKHLTQYTVTWTIRARITVKSDIRRFINDRGEGHIFNIILQDQTGEIKAAFFGKGVDKWFSVLMDDRTYFFSRGHIKLANKQFNKLDHTCELVFDEHSVIYQDEQTDKGPQMNYNFTNISDIENTQVNSKVDVIGIVSSYSDQTQIMLKNGTTREKREITIVDTSNCSISVSLWGNKSQSVSNILERGVIIAFKGLIVGDWNGKRLNTTSITRVDLEPDTVEAVNLRKWWNEFGKDNVSATLSSNDKQDVKASTIEEIKTGSVRIPDNSDGKPTYWTSYTTIEKINTEKFMYPACPECKKRLIQNTDHADQGTLWTCERCNKAFEEPKYTYMLNLTIIDETGRLPVSCFGEIGEEIMGGIKPNTLADLTTKFGQEVNISSNLIDIFTKRAFTYWLLKIRSKTEVYMDESKVKHHIVTANPINAFDKNYIKKLIQKIDSLLA